MAYYFRLHFLLGFVPSSFSIIGTGRSSRRTKKVLLSLQTEVFPLIWASPERIKLLQRALVLEKSPLEQELNLSKNSS